MLWRCNVLERVISRRMFITQVFASFRSLSSPTECLSHGPQSSFSARHCHQLPECPRIILTERIVHTTIVNCSSDVLAFSFFLWCARQHEYFHDRGTFAHMISVVSRLTQRFRTVKGVLKELDRVGSVIKPQTLLLLLRIYWSGGMYDKVFEAFEEMFTYGYCPNTFSRNIVMDVLFKIGRVEVALRVLKETQVPNFLTYSIAICNLCKLSDLVNLQDVLRSMLRKNYYLNQETFSMILSCYCKVGRIAEARQLLALMTVLGIPTCGSVWAALIDGNCKSGKTEAAVHLLEKMVQSGYAPNVVTFTSIVKGFFESRMPSSAFGILSTMESMGCYPDLVLCNVLIDCLSKMGRYDDAIDIFFGLHERRLIPDSYTLCSLISTVSLSKQFILLPTLIADIEFQPDLVVCNSFLSYFCKAGYPAGAIGFYNDMIDRGFVPDNYTFAGLLSGLCKSGRIADAVKVYYGLVRSHGGLDAHVHTVIINGLIKSGYLHRAISLFKKSSSENYPVDAVLYTVAIDGLIKGGQAGEAYALFSQMKEIGLAPNTSTYNLILSGFCNKSDVNIVKEVLLEMVEAGIEFDHCTLRLVKHFLHRSHHSASVLPLFTELLNSGTIHKKACAKWIYELVQDVNIGNLYTDNTFNNLDSGASSSDDILDVAVSVG